MPKFSITGPCSTGPTFRVHAAGCRDIRTDEHKYHNLSWVATAKDAMDLIEREMDDLNQQDGAGHWTLDEWHIAPCCANPDPLYGIGPMDWVLLEHLADDDKEPVQFVRRVGRSVTVVDEGGHPRCVDVSRLSQLE